MMVTCKCGAEFKTEPNQIKSGRGKFCSNACKYKYRVMPKRGKYKLHKENPTSFKKGIIPWNTGLKLPPPVNYRGNDVGYYGLHDWISYHYGKASKCEHCGTQNGRIEWANKTHDYKRVREDWMQLCKKCHAKYDRESGNWGIATQKFKLKGRCKRQH